MKKNYSKVLALMLTMTLLMGLMVGCNKGDDVATTEVAITQEATEIATTEVTSEEVTTAEGSEVTSDETLDSYADEVIISDEETWEYNGASVSYYEEILDAEWLAGGGGTYAHIKDNNTGIEMNVSTALWDDPNKFETSFDASNGKSFTTYCERTDDNSLELHNFNGGYLLIYDISKAERKDDGMSDFYNNVFVTQRDSIFSADTSTDTFISVLNDIYDWSLSINGDYDKVNTLDDGTQTRTVSVESPAWMIEGQKTIGFIQLTISPNADKCYIVWYAEPAQGDGSEYARESAQMCIESVKYPTN